MVCRQTRGLPTLEGEEGARGEGPVDGNQSPEGDLPDDPKLGRTILVSSSITQQWREMAPQGHSKQKEQSVAKVTHLET